MVVVVVEVGATGAVLEDCSVVVVLLDLSEPPQPASETVPAIRTMLVSKRRPDFLSVMETPL